jgi:DNA-binding transcriptional ArsR family regulator
MGAAAERVEVVDDRSRAAALLRGPRLRVVEALAERADSAAGLAGRLGVPRQTLNYHLRQLEGVGLLELVEERRKGNCVERVLRPAAAAFVISPTALGALAADPDRISDRFSAAYLLARAARLVRDLAVLARRAPTAPTLSLETEIRFASAADRAAFARELGDAVERLVATYHDDAAPRGRRFVLLAAVHPVPQKGDTQ